MAGAVPVVCMTALVLLSLVARDRKYELTSAGLMMLAGALAIYYGTIHWMLG